MLQSEMKKVIKKYGLQAGLAAAGLLGGFLYWRFVGCSTGSCPIWSHWYTSALMGGVMGYLIGDTISDYNKKRENERNVG